MLAHCAHDARLELQNGQQGILNLKTITAPTKLMDRLNSSVVYLKVNYRRMGFPRHQLSSLLISSLEGNADI